MKNEAAHLFETFITTYETTATETNQKTRILRCSFQNGTNHKSHSSNSFVDKFDFTPLKWQWYLTDKTISWHYLAGRIRPCGEICPLCHLHFARSWTSSYLHKVVIILTVLRNGNLRHFKAVNKIKLEMYVQLLRTLVFQTEHKSLFFFSLTHTRTYTLIHAHTHSYAHHVHSNCSWYSIKRIGKLFHLPMTHLNQRAVPNHKRCEPGTICWPRWHIRILTYVKILLNTQLTSNAGSDVTCIHNLLFQRLYERVCKILTSNY